MGQLVIKLAEEFGHEIVAMIHNQPNAFDCLPKGIDICIDFSVPDATVALCEKAAELQFSIVTGTTGLGEDQISAVKKCAESIPILMASNFSMGIHVLRGLVRKAANGLPSSFDIEIIEKHHSQKKDAPSGTALAIFEEIKGSRDSVQKLLGRHELHTRMPGEVGIHAIRGGSDAGSHEVLFLGPGESIEIIHRTENREVFARGSIIAAERFFKIRSPGLYNLSDIM
jgi:4-hydroxy-tetrahydrodipicolinate reductase